MLANPLKTLSIALLAGLSLSACYPENLQLAGDWQCGDITLSLHRNGNFVLKMDEDKPETMVSGTFRVKPEHGALRIRYSPDIMPEQRYAYIPGAYPAEGFYLNTSPDLRGEPKLCLRRSGLI